jgi:hypothetical protein
VPVALPPPSPITPPPLLSEGRGVFEGEPEILGDRDALLLPPASEALGQGEREGEWEGEGDALLLWVAEALRLGDLLGAMLPLLLREGGGEFDTVGDEDAKGEEEGQGVAEREKEGVCDASGECVGLALSLGVPLPLAQGVGEEDTLGDDVAFALEGEEQGEADGLGVREAEPLGEGEKLGEREARDEVEEEAVGSRGVSEGEEEELVQGVELGEPEGVGEALGLLEVEADTDTLGVAPRGSDAVDFGDKESKGEDVSLEVGVREGGPALEVAPLRGEREGLLDELLQADTLGLPLGLLVTEAESVPPGAMLGELSGEEESEGVRDGVTVPLEVPRTPPCPAVTLGEGEEVATDGEAVADVHGEPVGCAVVEGALTVLHAVAEAVARVDALARVVLEEEVEGELVMLGEEEVRGLGVVGAVEVPLAVKEGEPVPETLTFGEREEREEAEEGALGVGVAVSPLGGLGVEEMESRWGGEGEVEALTVGLEVPPPASRNGVNVGLMELVTLTVDAPEPVKAVVRVGEEDTVEVGVRVPSSPPFALALKGDLEGDPDVEADPEVLAEKEGVRVPVGQPEAVREIKGDFELETEAVLDLLALPLLVLEVLGVLVAVSRGEAEELADAVEVTVAI